MRFERANSHVDTFECIDFDFRHQQTVRVGERGSFVGISLTTATITTTVVIITVAVESRCCHNSKNVFLHSKCVRIENLLH